VFQQVRGLLGESLRTTDGKGVRNDPEMHQIKKGNRCYFGMKLHIGVDSQSELVHNQHPLPG
jgi:IS5 family transposase